MIENLSTSSLLYITGESNTSLFVIESLNHVFETILLASNEQEALEIYHEKHPSFILADINFPKMNVIGFLKNLRQIDTSTQIALTYSFDDIYKILKIVELDITKIIVKPITLLDLDNLLETFYKRHTGIKTYIIAPFWIFEPNSYIIKGPAKSYSLTKKECTFLSILFRNNKMITYDEMKKNLWKDSEMNDNVMHTFTKNIRKKLPLKVLKTVNGVGYKITS